MNREQRKKLHDLLNVLIDCQDTVTHNNEAGLDTRPAIADRTQAWDSIMAFVTDLTRNIDASNPRAGLRRCEVWDRPAYYHGRDDGGDRVEFENGECVRIGWSLLKFTDIPEPSND